jgi:hypothetical protein
MIIVPLPVSYPDFQIANLAPLDADAVPLAANYTVVIKYAASAILATGTQIRLYVEGPGTPGTTCTINNCFIGLPAASGDSYDFSTAGGTRITFSGGSSSITLQAGQRVYSDMVTFDLEAVPTIIAMDLASGSVQRYKGGLSTTKYNASYLSGGTEAGNTDKTTGYIPAGGLVPVVRRIEVGGIN